MKRMSRISWLVIVNTATLVAATGWAASQFWPAKPVPAAKQGRGPAKALSVFPSAHTTTADIEQFPIFNRLRKSMPETSAAAPAESPPISVPPVLLGIVGEPGHLRALLEDPSASARKLVRRGEVFIGWTIVSVSGKSAQLQAAGQHVKLSLNAPRPGPSDGATPEPAAQ